MKHMNYRTSKWSLPFRPLLFVLHALSTNLDTKFPVRRCKSDQYICPPQVPERFPVLCPIVQHERFGRGSLLNFFVSGFIEFPSYALVFWGTKNWGRRPTLISCMAAGGMACAAVLLVPSGGEEESF
ncbi:hypothetical protein CEXT_580091 [Caerostris extrusa]|uniref:Uncharacterized protein n=1 Tax=Caerostris extrusa TaxID=172846 RepID=A0AAV4MA35_CAEEX|nr:hypothetical protein CEXT_580091 [Caerostris extrusa]